MPPAGPASPLRPLAALALAATAAAAHAAPWSLTVASGAIDRSNLPIRARVTLPAAHPAAGGGPARVTLADGSQVDGQIVPAGLLEAGPGPDAGRVACDLVFVLPKLPAGEKVTLTAEPVEPAEPQAQPGQAAQPARLAWVDEAGAASLLVGGKPLVRYEMRPYDASTPAARELSYKPFHHVFDPATGIRLTKGDGGKYPHHRGIFFGYNKIGHGPDRKTISDCWHCQGDARQENREVLRQMAGPVEGLQRVSIDWIGRNGGKVLGEERELAVVPVPGGTVIDFASRLAADAAVKLDGDPQHAGVHFRASNEVSETTAKETYYLRPGTRAAPGEFRNWPDDRTYVDAPWHAASFVVGGQRYTVLRADRPANPGEARMSERDYARFGSYFAHDLEPGRPLLVGYRFWVQPGEMSLEEAARIAADYATPATVTVTGGER